MSAFESRPTRRNDDPPRVVAHPSRSGLACLCPFCGATHHHGPTYGTRAAHCSSPLQTGRLYCLVPPDDEEP
jgi:hypothetical protein